MQIPSPQLLNYQRKEKKKKGKEKSIGPYDRGKDGVSRVTIIK